MSSFTTANFFVKENFDNQNNEKLNNYSIHSIDDETLQNHSVKFIIPLHIDFKSQVEHYNIFNINNRCYYYNSNNKELIQRVLPYQDGPISDCKLLFQDNNRLLFSIIINSTIYIVETELSNMESKIIKKYLYNEKIQVFNLNMELNRRINISLRHGKNIIFHIKNNEYKNPILEIKPIRKINLNTIKSFRHELEHLDFNTENIISILEVPYVNDDIDLAFIAIKDIIAVFYSEKGYHYTFYLPILLDKTQLTNNLKNENNQNIIIKDMFIDYDKDGNYIKLFVIYSNYVLKIHKITKTNKIDLEEAENEINYSINDNSYDTDQNSIDNNNNTIDNNDNSIKDDKKKESVKENKEMEKNEKNEKNTCYKNKFEINETQKSNFDKKYDVCSYHESMSSYKSDQYKKIICNVNNKPNIYHDDSVTINNIENIENIEKINIEDQIQNETCKLSVRFECEEISKDFIVKGILRLDDRFIRIIYESNDLESYNYSNNCNFLYFNSNENSQNTTIHKIDLAV